MANKKFLAGILVLALVFTMALVGCSDDGGTDSGLNGTWVSGGFQLKLNNGSYEITNNGIALVKGTYTTSGNNITLKPTHYWIETKWYSRADCKGLGFSEAELNEMFETDTDTYSVSGDQFTWGGSILTKR